MWTVRAPCSHSHLSFPLTVYFSIHPSIPLTVYFSIQPSIHFIFHPLTLFCIHPSPTIHPSIHPSSNFVFHPSIHSLYFPSPITHPSIHPYTHFIFHPSIYIYAFSRRFYPKRLTVHSGYTGYTFFVSTRVPWESNPQPLRC